MAPSKPSQILGKREASLFKDLMKYYETKAYKKGLKAADQILKKNSDHGETLAMRGLVLNSMDRKPEAIENIKKGLMMNMTSHVCWHVYGLVHRSNRDYQEAVKCYKQALKIDKDNMQILRDLSLLQIQLRDLSGFSDTRNTILTLSPGLRFNWISYAVASHLAGEHSTAVSALDSFLAQVKDETMKISETEREAEFVKSEVLMYRNEVLMETPGGEKLKEAYEDLCSFEADALDRDEWLWRKGKLELKRGMYADAEATFLSMLKDGQTEDYRVHAGYQCALLKLEGEKLDAMMALDGMDTPLAKLNSSLTPEQKAQVIEIYDTVLLPINDRSAAIKRIPMTAIDPPSLSDRLGPYMEKALKKGVPSLGSDVLRLVSVDGVRVTDPEAVRAHPVYEAVRGLAADLKPRAPEVWTCYLQAQLCEAVGDYEEGIALLDSCIGKAPDDKAKGDLLERKARLLKLSGDIDAAVEAMNEARELDKADRYINNKTTKYLLRAGKPDEAEATIGLFTRHEANPSQNLFEMQCSWFELEYARAMQRKGDIGKALKKFACIEKHFEDFADDQFDFHNYCIRRATLRAYVSTLRLEDHIWNNKFYVQAACGAIECYLHLIDNPPSAEELGGEPDYSGMTAAQKKKAKAAARKKKKREEEAEAKRKEEEAAKKKREEEAANKKKEEGGDADAGDGDDEDDEDKKPPPSEDKDPNGIELMKKDPRAECEKFASSLRLHCPHLLVTWLKTFDVRLSAGDHEGACEALEKATDVDADSEEVWARVVRLGMDVKDKTAEGAAVEKLSALLGGVSVEDFVKSKASKAQGLSLLWRCAVAEACALVKVDAGAEAAKVVLNGGAESKGAHLVVNCVKAKAALEKMDAGAAEEWALLCKKKFVRAKCF
mmetsp:Transcript_22357/g.44641  ORF Transcript_22357/g.44641 Transcript_22357/m.44641 type:complete len:889 (+) Transcript_22357:86-2752(+)|eukprot:CAMPEP_0182453884 /NCGR_PEP_ID=MMETSP1319-20130603/751_1 /TAXON_ID=172717 /ORGANISM="Bolidomonas pacifica, Strain RCC208" /LENGTH=888 /DNA_ID=CAMNT_0024651843 /DNA_START=81 /DNA_END=2747 /DNA_ORIENTATION=-